MLTGGSSVTTSRILVTGETAYILEAAENAGIQKFIFTGTSSVQVSSEQVPPA